MCAQGEGGIVEGCAQVCFFSWLPFGGTTAAAAAATAMSPAIVAGFFFKWANSSVLSAHAVRNIIITAWIQTYVCRALLGRS